MSDSAIIVSIFFAVVLGIDLLLIALGSLPIKKHDTRDDE
jgi:hypothetical protein